MPNLESKPTSGRARTGARQADSVLVEIGRIIGSTLDFDEVYERFAEQAKTLIPFDRIVIAVLDSETGSLRVAHAAGVEVDRFQVGAAVPTAPGSSLERVVRSRGAIVLDLGSGCASPEDEVAAALASAGLQIVPYRSAHMAR